MTSLVLAGYASCKKPFSPNLTTVTTNFLAVDGPILSGDSTIISLSRTTSLSDTTQNKVELKAIVSVEDDQAKLYPLTELGKGKYALGVTNFDASRKYRLDIKTSNGKIYQSDFVPMKVTPPIDSIYFKQNSDASVLFYVNAHDATNSTRYYRWDYKETWSYVSLFTAYYQYKNNAVVPIVFDTPDDISTCYRGDVSNQIFIGSSAKLTEDVIAGEQLGGIVSGSEKVAQKYVMRLRQYALTQDGFNYYQNLKINTEQLGSIFDAQPTTTVGNIHCITSPGDLVLGFISASTATSKQFNLKYQDLPLQVSEPYDIVADSTNSLVASHYFPPPGLTGHVCIPNTGDYVSPSPYVLVPTPGATWRIFFTPTATYNSRIAKVVASGDSLVFNTMLGYDLNLDIVGYYYAPKICVDCRLKGGTNIRPSYFPPH